MAILSCGIFRCEVDEWGRGGVTTLDMCCPSLKEWPNGQHRANGLVLHHIRSRFASGFSEKVGPPDRWRIAGGIHSEDGGKNCGLSVEVRKFKDKNDQEGD